MNLKTVLTKFRTRKLVAAACYLGVISLVMMAWSVLYKAALPIVIGMGVGQAVGVLAFLLYAVAVLGDIYRGDVDEVIPPSRGSVSPPSSAGGGDGDADWVDEPAEEAEPR